MKTKLLSTLVCLYMLTNISFAQENNVLIDISAGMTKHLNFAMSFKGIYSHSYNEHFALGGGTGVLYNNQVESTNGNNYEDFSLEIPIVVNIRGNIIKETKNMMPYYSLSVGYIYPIKKAKYEYLTIGGNESYENHTVIKYNEGFFAAPEFGVTFNDMSIGVEIMYGMESYSENRVEYYDAGLFIEETYKTESQPIYVINFKFIQKI